MSAGASAGIGSSAGALPRGGRIALIGMMTAGKSTTGLRLSRMTGLPFRDLDDLIVRRSGRPIPEIFATDGEAFFRALETEALAAAAAAGDPVIMACGGGAVLAEKNRLILADSFFTVWLKVGPEEALRRAALQAGKRPLLETPDRERRVRELIAERTPIYESCADLVIDCDIPMSVDARSRVLFEALSRAAIS